MNRYDLHTHTVYCDGKNTPEERVFSALRQLAPDLAPDFAEFVRLAVYDAGMKEFR